MKSLGKKIMLWIFWFGLGRKNLARFARFLGNEARLDVCNHIASNGESLVQEIILKYAPRDKSLVIFDVGANVGDWTRVLMLKCAQLRPNKAKTKVFMFEPCASTYEDLQKAMQSWSGHVIMVRKALSNNIGKSRFYVVAKGAGRNSLYPQLDENIALRETVEVTTVDLFSQEACIGHIVFMKVDTEGHDMLVIEGASKMIEQQAIELIQFEYNYRWIDSRRYLRDAFEFLTPHGYKIGKITPKGIEFYKEWHQELESFREGNYLACIEGWTKRFPTIRWWNE